jgi:hypothetical protein
MNKNPKVIYPGHVSLVNTIKVPGASLVTQLQVGSEVSSWLIYLLKEGSLFGLSLSLILGSPKNCHAFGIVGKPLMSCVGIVRRFCNV